jgi:hypothetical protein
MISPKHLLANCGSAGLPIMLCLSRGIRSEAKNSPAAYQDFFKPEQDGLSTCI